MGTEVNREGNVDIGRILGNGSVSDLLSVDVQLWQPRRDASAGRESASSHEGVRSKEEDYL